MAAADDALRAASAVGPYFTWESRPAGARSGWRPLRDLTDGTVVAERVGLARLALARTFGLSVDAVPPRAAASITFLGLAARLLSPPLGALVLAGTLPAPGLDGLWWKPAPDGPLPIAYATVTEAPADGASLVATTVNGLIAPVLRCFRERFLLSPQVLWGNVASALAGAAGVLADCDAISRSGVAERAGVIVAQALAQPPLAGTGRLVRPDPEHARRFLVRHNCCLYYRIPGGATCGDCVLTPEPARRRHWRSVLASPR